MLIKARPIKPTIIGENLDIGPMKDVKFTPIHDNAKSKTANPIINIPNNCIKLELCSFTFAFTFTH